MNKARDKYIDLLDDFSGRTKDAKSYDDDFNDENRRLIEELHGAGMLGGSPVAGGIIRLKITLEGRLLLDRLRKEQKAESWSGIISSYRPFILGIIAGVVINLSSSIFDKPNDLPEIVIEQPCNCENPQKHNEVLKSPRSNKAE